ncbi:MAG: hypothetical protein U9O82_11585 [Thermodesulfobacteriota bacterium]|nr:hypothetical protein [Thermodesulfobacteriota bacterium]
MLNYNQNMVAEKPVEVINAVRLIYGSICAGIINSVIEHHAISIEEWLPQIVFSYGISFLLATKILLGKNWARITYLIIIFIGIPPIILNFINTISQSPTVGAIMLLTFVLQIAAVVLLLKNKSKTWFKAQKVQLNSEDTPNSGDTIRNSDTNASSSNGLPEDSDHLSRK